MNDTKQSTEDLAILEQLNKDFFHSELLCKRAALRALGKRDAARRLARLAPAMEDEPACA